MIGNGTELYVALKSGAQIRVRLGRSGSNPAPQRLLLLHGNPGSIADWEKMTPLLSAQSDWAAVDLPGFGESARPPHWREALSLEGLADAVIEVAALLEWDTFYVVGHSHGGGVAATAAARHPQRIQGVILIASLGAIPHRSYAVLAVPGVRWLLRCVGALLGVRLGRVLLRALLARAMSDVFSPERPHPDRIERELDALSRRPDVLLTMADVARGAPSKTLAALAPGVRCPTLILHGERDNVIPVVSARRLHQLMRSEGGRPQLEIFSNAGHMIPEYQTAEAARLVLDFLKMDASRHEVPAG